MKILINAKTDELCKSILTAFDDFSAEFVLCSSDEQENNLELSEFGVMIVSTPLRSEFGLNFVTEASQKTDAAMILLARADIADDVQSRIKFTGAFVLPRPFSKSVLAQTVKTAMIAKENITRLEKEKSELLGQLDDAKTINRAKCILIQYLNMTEDQAHKHIQKTAMDTRRTQREIAEDILRTYSI
ncbi:MAG: ANTAR domain-containing protein [Oscillospiraceae bacterium]|nr:ANTAR domain-containing protein [Oscillospiraceae bacterium]